MQANLITCKEVTVRYRYNPGGVHSVKDLLTHVTKPFQYKTILHQLSFSLSRGESMGVLGRNGSGKSTLLQILSGYLSSSEGKIIFRKNETEISSDLIYKQISFASPYMELIEEFESTPRGLFSGTIGYITPEGDFDFNVVIRSVFYNSTTQYLSFKAGGGITNLSDLEEEYKESCLKVEAIIKVLNS